MTEVEFVARRIIKEADEWTRNNFNERDQTASQLYFRNQATARLQLIEHLRKQFLEGKTE
jgi:hypothetical protein